MPDTVVERIMALADQPTRLACREVSKSFLQISQAPGVWTSLYIRSPDPRASDFLTRCTSCTTVDMVTSEDTGPFLSHVYPKSIQNVRLNIYASTIPHHFIQHVLDAFPGTTHLAITIDGLDAPVTMRLPDVTLETFDFEDVRLLVELQCGRYDIGTVNLKVDSTDASQHVDTLWTTSTGLSSFAGTATCTVVDLDADYAFNARLRTATLEINMNGLNLFVPHGIFDDIDTVTFEFHEDGKIVFYGVDDIMAFFRDQTHLKIPNGAHLELRPYL